jgi:hypothetical protein
MIGVFELLATIDVSFLHTTVRKLTENEIELPDVLFLDQKEDPTDGACGQQSLLSTKRQLGSRITLKEYMERLMLVLFWPLAY